MGLDGVPTQDTLQVTKMQQFRVDLLLPFQSGYTWLVPGWTKEGGGSNDV